MTNDRSSSSVIDCAEELLRAAPLPHERVLYWGSGSPQAWRVLIALEEKKLPYRSVCVSFSSGVLKAPFFQALNPRMRIPVLVEPVRDFAPGTQQQQQSASPAHTTETTIMTTTTSTDGGVNAATVGISQLLTYERTVVYESAAILEYLERKAPSHPCMPTSLPLYAIAQTRLQEANEILSVVGDLVVYLRRFPPEKRNPYLVDAKWSAVEAELALWERYLDGHQFLVDTDVPYLCDFTLFTNIAYAVRCGLQLDGLYPRLAMFYMRLCARQSIEKTWPPHWKTTIGHKVLTKCFDCAGRSASCPCHQLPLAPPSLSSSSTAPSSSSGSHTLVSPPPSHS